MTKQDILTYIDNPKELEMLYRNDKLTFKQEFQSVYPELSNNPLANFWNERLNYETEDISWGSKKELAFVIIAAIVAGMIAKLPHFLGVHPDFFYPRNIGFIAFPVLTAYFSWKNSLPLKNIILFLSVTLIGLTYINLLPPNEKSDTLILACIHLPILLWTVLGISFTGNNVKEYQPRIKFLRYNGDLVILATLIAISGGILTGATIGLFSIIGIDIKTFYLENIGVFGVASIPIIATFIANNNPQLINKVSPLIAKIFSPLVLLTLVVYLSTVLFTGKNPYTDRNFLVMFNAVLLGVMAIILFSVAETLKNAEQRTNSFILFLLSIVTVLINCIALSAILFRISEWGMTPNRFAVLGSNILMLANLVMITYRLWKKISRKGNRTEVENAIAMFLPVYSLWAVIVTFIFPFLFRFK